MLSFHVAWFGGFERQGTMLSTHLICRAVTARPTPSSTTSRPANVTSSSLRIPTSLTLFYWASNLISCCSSRPATSRSEEHTSELQSRSDLVCRLLLEKKKQSDTHSQRSQPKKYASKYRARHRRSCGLKTSTQRICRDCSSPPQQREHAPIPHMLHGNY